MPRYANIGVGVSTHGADSSSIERVNVGLFSYADTLRGAQLGIFSSTVRGSMCGFNMSGLFAQSGGDALGVQMSGFHGSAGGKVTGFQMSGISSVAEQIRGVQMSAFSNICGSPLQGLQLSAVSNISRGVRRGVQMSALVNVSNAVMRGVQAGGYNYADTLTGVQLGVINAAVSRPRGFQVGLVNYSRDTGARKIGLVNISPETEIDVLLFAGNTSKMNGALRFRNRSTYNMIGVGTHYVGLDKRFSGAVFYRLGQYFNLSRRWSVSGDIGFSHIETFEENSRTKPERLYSLQATLNADYRVSPTVGLFASVGYADTRRYGSRQRFEDKLVGNIGLSVAYSRRHNARRSYTSFDAPATAAGDSLGVGLALPQKKRYWLAAAEATGINLLVFSFDRFVMNEDFAQVNIHTIRNNLKTGFVWDNDPFSTNLFAHPYHGNLYYNSARSNGLTFWESVPYAFCGSLMWELFAESEPPAINDLIATSMGGTAIGEITNRLSRVILNDRVSGFGRFLRETAAFIVNPIQGFNRLLRGDAWRVRPSRHLYHDYSRTPVHLSLSLGTRYLADDGALFRGESNPYAGLDLEYGDLFDEAANKPYDYFTVSVTLGLSGNQPLLNTAHLLGRLWSAPVFAGKGILASFGLFQHFNFYNSEPVKDGTSLTPYRISEAVAFGPGLTYQFRNAGNIARLEQRIYASAIVLGGSKSDYYNVIDRDYNMGSGYSLKGRTVMAFQRLGVFVFGMDYYRIFTWKGYEDKDLAGKQPLYYNVQGDRSNAELIVITPKFRFDIKGGLAAELSGSYFVRATRYKYHPDVRSNTFEFKLGLAYRL